MTEPYRIVASPGIPGVDLYAEGSEIAAALDLVQPRTPT